MRRASPIQTAVPAALFRGRCRWGPGINLLRMESSGPDDASVDYRPSSSAARIEVLSTDFREVLVLRELEGLSYKEIAAIVGIPLGIVMSRLARARERLAGVLAMND